jgi:hypothetical protein
MPEDDTEERLVREMLTESYREIVPHISSGGDALIRRLARAFVARGGRVLIGPKPAPVVVKIHQSIDEEMRLVWMDKEWRTVMGYPNREGIGRLFTDLLAPSSARFFVEHVWPLVYRDETRLGVGPVVLHLINRTGRMLTATYKGTAIRDTNGAFERTFSKLHVTLGVLAAILNSIPPV